jgi:cell division protein ZapA (FtsZ GTPase activity inhibitor)
MEQELVGIQIKIAGKAYPLRIDASETEMVQNVADDINEKINTLQRTYPRQDKDDYISMAFLSYAIDSRKNQSVQPQAAAPKIVSIPEPTPVVAPQSNAISDEFIEKILKLDAFLDKVLQI